MVSISAGENLAGIVDTLKNVAGEELYFNPLKTSLYVNHACMVYENAVPTFQGISPLTSYCSKGDDVYCKYRAK